MQIRLLCIFIAIVAYTNQRQTIGINENYEMNILIYKAPRSYRYLKTQFRICDEFYELAESHSAIRKYNFNL